jgi:hypothetical protein
LCPEAQEKTTPLKWCLSSLPDKITPLGKDEKTQLASTILIDVIV